MRIVRDSEIVIGFTIERPFAGLRAITHCGEALCTRHHQLSVHAHPGLELMYLVSGAVAWEVAGLVIRQSAGELVVVAPGRPHQTAAFAHPEFKALYVGLDGSEMGRLSAALQVPGLWHPARNLGRCEEIEPVMRGIFQQALAPPAATSEVPLRFAELLAALVRSRMSRPFDRAPPSRFFSVPVQKAVHHLNRNLNRRVTVAESAGIAHFSAAHFAALFHREVGMAPGAFHRQLRLEAARTSLRSPGSSVGSTALEFGFSSSQHFSTVFRQAFGCTPREWIFGVAAQRSGTGTRRRGSGRRGARSSLG